MKRYLLIGFVGFLSLMAKADYTISKLVLNEGIISFVASDGTVLASEKISDIVRIDFVKTPTEVPAVPTTIEDMQDPVSYRVYDISGKCVLSGYGSTIPVQGLENGVYIMQVNTQMVKFIKN